MCGIAGIVGRRGEYAREKFKALLKELAHRGPDDEGAEFIRPEQSAYDICFLHRRLSIIDLSARAHQPMVDAATGNCIVYNGEIYNHNEIREDLKRQGHRFKSDSDTEVILKGYSAYGIDVLHKLKGMFAFSIWDKKENKIFLAVDPMGIKPLYYYLGKKNEPFIFSSEISALLESGVLPKSLNLRALQSYFAFGAPQGPETVIEGVCALLPGRYATYDIDKGKFVSAFYDQLALKPGPPREALTIEQASETFIRLLSDSVKRHLVSDVPVGLFLSGGIDSGALAALTHALTDKKGIDTFSVIFEEEEFSEAEYSRLLAQKFSGNHHEIKIAESELLENLDNALDAMDQPSVDGINTYMISKAVRSCGIKTVLSGQGADEILGGYKTFHFLGRAYQSMRLLNFLPQQARGAIAALAKYPGKCLGIKSKALDMIKHGGSLQGAYLTARELSDEATWQAVTGSQESLFDMLHAPVGERIRSEAAARDLVGQISIFELRLYLANTLLRDSDVMSMAHGLEIRVPYLDYDLVRFALAVPGVLKLRGKIPKPLILNSLKDILPSAVYTRPKMGFTFPWAIWMRVKLRKKIEEAFHDDAAAKVLGLNARRCQHLWRLYLKNGKSMNWSFFWSLYVALSWVRTKKFL